MTRRRFALLLAAAIAAIVSALYLGRQRQPAETSNAALFPSLATQLNAVTSVTVRKSATVVVTMHRIGDAWTVAQRGDYPANVGKLRELLISLRDARIVEEKTSDVARYGDIGVEDLVGPAATGTEISVQLPAATDTVIVGKPAGDGSFVRRTGEKRSYSIEPAISLDAEPHSWIDARLIDVPVTLVQSVESQPANGFAYLLRRETDAAFSLVEAPAGRRALDGHALAPAPTTFAALEAEDVAAAKDIDFTRADRLIVTLTDGNVLVLMGVVMGDRHWIALQSSKDAALTAKTAAHAYEVASYRYDGMFKPVEQLLAPAAVTAPAPNPTPPGRRKAAAVPAS